MKTHFLKPGFEFIFSLTLIVILALPPVLLAQTQKPAAKDFEITIINGDTTINGKKISELSADDRTAVLKDIGHIEKPDSAGSSAMHMQRHRMMMKDSTGNNIGIGSLRLRKRPGNFNMDGKNRPGFNRDVQNMPDMRMRRNTENFDYVSTDNDGISTHVRFHIADASNTDLKRMEYVEGPKFEIRDLSMVPEFASGKTLLIINLPLKTPASVKLSDSQGKVLWSEKAVGGTLNKTFTLSLNGIYFLQVKQGNAFAVKRIIKEE